MKGTKKNISLEDYLKTVYTSTKQSDDYATFLSKSMSLASSIEGDFWNKDSEGIFTTILHLIKKSKISIDDVKYLMSDSTLFEGFSRYLNSTMESDNILISKRIKKSPSTITFDTLDEIILERLGTILVKN